MTPAARRRATRPGARPQAARNWSSSSPGVGGGGGGGGGLEGGEDGGHAGVGALEQAAPVVAGPGPEHGGQPFAQQRPAGAVVLVGQVLGGQADPLQELGEELGLQGADGQVAAVGG